MSYRSATFKRQDIKMMKVLFLDNNNLSGVLTRCVTPPQSRFTTIVVCYSRSEK